MVKCGFGALRMRKAKISLECKIGTVNQFLAYQSGVEVIAMDGKKKREWQGDVADANVPFLIEAWGSNGAQFSCEIDCGRGYPVSTHTITGGKDEIRVVL